MFIYFLLRYSTFTVQKICDRRTTLHGQPIWAMRFRFFRNRDTPSKSLQWYYKIIIEVSHVQFSALTDFLLSRYFHYSVQKIVLHNDNNVHFNVYFFGWPERRTNKVFDVFWFFRNRDTPLKSLGWSSKIIIKVCSLVQFQLQRAFSYRYIYYSVQKIVPNNDNNVHFIMYFFSWPERRTNKAIMNSH